MPTPRRYAQLKEICFLPPLDGAVAAPFSGVQDSALVPGREARTQPFP